MNLAPMRLWRALNGRQPPSPAAARGCALGSRPRPSAQSTASALHAHGLLPKPLCNPFPPSLLAQPRALPPTRGSSTDCSDALCAKIHFELPERPYGGYPLLHCGSPLLLQGEPPCHVRVRLCYQPCPARVARVPPSQTPAPRCLHLRSCLCAPHCADEPRLPQRGDIKT